MPPRSLACFRPSPIQTPNGRIDRPAVAQSRRKDITSRVPQLCDSSTGSVMGKVSRRAAPHRDPTVCSRRRGGGSAGTRGEGGLPGHGRRQWACPPSPPIETGIKARRVHRDGGTRECSRYFGCGRSSTAAQGTRSVVRGPSFAAACDGAMCLFAWSRETGGGGNEG